MEGQCFCGIGSTGNRGARKHHARETLLCPRPGPVNASGLCPKTLLVSVGLGGGAATGDLVTVTKRVSGRDGPITAKGSGPRVQMLPHSQRRIYKERAAGRLCPLSASETAGSVSPLSGYPGTKRVSSTACSRDSRSYTARARLCASTVSAVALPCLCSNFAKYSLPGWFCRQQRTAASATAQRRCTLPIFWPEVPSRFPPDSLAHFTKRQYETKSCTRGKRAMSWIS